jgi:chromosome partitioning protein
MQVIVFASQKGGAGKTTLCGQLAVQAELVGAGPVCLVDTDPQGSLAEWWNARPTETPVFVQTHFSTLLEDLETLRNQGIKLVFIDTPPAVTDTIPHDLRAVGATVDIIEGHDKPMIFTVNAATKRARITGEAAVALSQHGTVAPVTIHQRVDFATSMIDGRTVMEMNSESASSQEIIDLWQYVASRLGKMERRQRQVPHDGPERRVAGIGSPPARTPVFGRRGT